jgi:hypothetical protein
MQEIGIVDLVSLTLSIVTTLFTTLVLVLSYRTSREVNRIESEIKQTEFHWRTLERKRRELAAKLRFLHVLDVFADDFELISELPREAEYRELAKYLKPLAEEYGDAVTMILSLYTEVDRAIRDPTFWDEHGIIELSSRVAETIAFLDEDISDLESELSS